MSIKKINNLAWIIITGLVGVFIFQSVKAAGMFDYRLLETIPMVGNTGTSPDIPTLVLGLYKLGLWTIMIGAFFMLSVGGFYYMTSAGNTSTAGTAKKIIGDSLLGLFVGLTAWGLLYIINPELVARQGGATNISFFNLSVNGGVTGAINHVNYTGNAITGPNVNYNSNTNYNYNGYGGLNNFNTNYNYPNLNLPQANDGCIPRSNPPTAPDTQSVPGCQACSSCVDIPSQYCIVSAVKSATVNGACKALNFDALSINTDLKNHGWGDRQFKCQVPGNVTYGPANPANTYLMIRQSWPPDRWPNSTDPFVDDSCHGSGGCVDAFLYYTGGSMVPYSDYATILATIERLVDAGHSVVYFASQSICVDIAQKNCNISCSITTSGQPYMHIT